MKSLFLLRNDHIFKDDLGRLELEGMIKDMETNKNYHLQMLAAGCLHALSLAAYRILSE